MSRIVVTGGAGFIASHIVDEYIRLGHRVAVVDNLHHGFRRNLSHKATFHNVDIRDQKKLEAVFKKVRPELVNHHAAISEVTTSMRDPDTTLEVNVVGTANVLRCGMLVKTRKIIFASTGGTIYGNADQLPTPETAPLQPISAYAASKQLGEAWIQYYQRAYGLRYTIFRYGNVFGARQDPHGEAGVVAIFVQRLQRKEPTTIFGDGGKTRDYVYIKDIVQANRLALSKGNNTILNLGRGQGITDKQVFTVVAQHFPGTAQPHHRPVRAGEVTHTFISAVQAKRVLGWKPHWTFTAGVTDYVQRLGYVN